MIFFFTGLNTVLWKSNVHTHTLMRVCGWVDGWVWYVLVLAATFLYCGWNIQFHIKRFYFFHTLFIAVTSHSCIHSNTVQLMASVGCM